MGVYIYTYTTKHERLVESKNSMIKDLYCPKLTSSYI